MGDKTAIEWADASWNPIRALNVGTLKRGWYCRKISQGCANCYAERINLVRGNALPYSHAQAPNVKLFLDEKTLEQPLYWRRPRKIFVCSMSDLFLEDIADSLLESVFETMTHPACSHHIFQVLTKRPERMLTYVSRMGRSGWIPPDNDSGVRWPAPNIWLGVSVENQETADSRIPLLLQTPAAVRFVSYEPALGPVDFTKIDYREQLRTSLVDFARWSARKDGEDEEAAAKRADAEIPRHKLPEGENPALNVLTGEWFDGWDSGTEGKKLDWIIAGGESGPHARPSHPEWFQAVRDQCQAAGVPYFFKQWGEFAPHLERLGGGLFVRPNGSLGTQGEFWDGQAAAMIRVGKKAAGRLLDGREWNEFPRMA